MHISLILAKQSTSWDRITRLTIQSKPIDESCQLPLAFNLHYTDIPKFTDAGDVDSLGVSWSKEQAASEEHSGDDARFHIDYEEILIPLPADTTIHSIKGLRIASSTQDFTLVIVRTYRNTQPRVRTRSSTSQWLIL